MLHEILLALSGHRSPLLSSSESNRTQAKAGADSSSATILTPPERQLLQKAEHLSELHYRLASRSSQISAAHKSIICRAVATAISSVHLAALQRKILAVEESILKNEAEYVGAYSIVPLTAIVGEFGGWTRRLEWLWDVTGFMIRERDEEQCNAAQLIDHLRSELRTGYPDIEEAALSLVQVAESAWLRQVSAWVFYGRIPTSGQHDFFVERDDEDEQGYSLKPHMLPSFVTSSTASSMLFIGVSLDRLRSRRVSDFGRIRMDDLSSEIQQLTALQFPLKSVALARAITSIRMTLSRTSLQKLLPISKVFELLQLLREFFLLGRGEFAMALTQQADEKVRNRWKRTNGLPYEKRDGAGTITVKEGEVSATLARTMAFVGTMQGEHAEEDEGLELARDLLRLTLHKQKAAPTSKNSSDASDHVLNSMVQTPFRNLLFSVPAVLTMHIPEPSDLFLSEADLQVYTIINSYLLSVRRAHIRLTDLWKITSLRRQHPAPPRAPQCCTRGGGAHTKVLRERWNNRASIMRSPWTTCSAAIFFLAETEAYLQVEVVEGLWEDFFKWLKGDSIKDQAKPPEPQKNNEEAPQSHTGTQPPSQTPLIVNPRGISLDPPQASYHDPQSLATAHRRYLKTLTRRLLLTRPSFTGPLYNLLIHLDHLVASVHRLHAIWTSMDLEEDEGVVEAFSNLAAEERDVRSSLRDIEGKVKSGIEEAVEALRGLSVDSGFLAEMEGDDDNGFGSLNDSQKTSRERNGGMRYGAENEEDLYDELAYRPKRVGGIDRLLMKLDFGVWFGPISSSMAHRHGEF